jgi:hypothetical protein
MAGDCNPEPSNGHRTATPIDQSHGSLKIDPKWLVDPKFAVPQGSSLSPEQTPLLKIPDLSLSHDPSWNNNQSNDDKLFSQQSGFNTDSAFSRVYSNHHVNLRAIIRSNQWDDFSDSASRYNLGLALNIGGTALDMAGLPANNFQTPTPYQSQYERNLRQNSANFSLGVIFHFR